MPLRKQIKPLKQLCIDVINLTISVQKHRFRSLPPSLLEELILYPNDDNQSLKLSISDKLRMIRKEVTRLKLEFEREWKREWSVNILNAAARTCQGLTHLTLTNTCMLTYGDYCDFVRRIPNIIALKIYSESINDDVLEAIGDNCPKLENLYLRSIRSSISDNGIRRFCQSKSRGSNLKYLNFFLSNITVEGVLIALCNLQNLRELNYDKVIGRYDFKVIEAFKKMFGELNKSEELPTFQLCKLPGIQLNGLPSGFLQFLTKCCPNVPNLALLSNNNFGDDVIEIINCDKKLPFSLNMWHYLMKETLIPDFSDVGSKLTCLSISNGEKLHWIEIDLKSIGFTCPNLEELFLDNLYYMPITNVKRGNEQIPFRKLLKLTLCSIPNSHLKFVLQNCLSLEQLRMKGNKEVNDDVMINILHEVNPLRYLIHFYISQCHNLTKRMIMKLLMMENNLQYLDIYHCMSVRHCDISQIKSYIEKSNFGVEIQFTLLN